MLKNLLNVISNAVASPVTVVLFLLVISFGIFGTMLPIALAATILLTSIIWSGAEVCYVIDNAAKKQESTMLSRELVKEVTNIVSIIGR